MASKKPAVQRGRTGSRGASTTEDRGKKPDVGEAKKVQKHAKRVADETNAEEAADARSSSSSSSSEGTDATTDPQKAALFQQFMAFMASSLGKVSTFPCIIAI